LVQQAQDQARHKQAAAKAKELYSQAAPADDGQAYLLKKGVTAHKTFKVYHGNLSIDGRPADGALIVPIGDERGLSGLEFIWEDGTKRPLPGGDYKAKYFRFGEAPTDKLNICEGISTGASIFAATNTPTFCARSCSNLKNVAQALQQRYPDCSITICGDISNGEQDANKAAQAVQGFLVLPQFLKGEGSDFNDLHQIEGLEAVKAAFDNPEVVESAEWAVVDTDASEDGSKSAKQRKADKQAEHLASGLPYGFTISKQGVYFTPDGTDDKPGTPMRICSPLWITAMSRGTSSADWGRVIKFDDSDGVSHEWAVPMEMMASDGAEMRRELSRLGLIISPSIAAKNRLLEYISLSAPKERARCVLQTGWHNNVFVMPDRTIGDSKEFVLYQTEGRTSCQYQQLGTLEQWRDNVANLCVGNSRLIFSVSASFAGMILRLAGQESGGLHFVGSSSTGKSTAQLVAASVYGSQAFKQSWRATGNALEGTCSLHNDAALILDEMAEVDPKEIGSIVYMIGNGTGKGRAGRTGEARQRKTWRLMIISSGEIGLVQHMRDGGKIAKAGQEVRMIDIAADAGAGHGLFEELHGYEGGAKLSDAIKEATQNYYGVPAIAFLEHLTSDLHDFPATLKQAMAGFVEDHLPSDAAGQAARICNKFAIIAIAGEYATGAGITGWQQGDAVTAAGTCFKAWLDSRGGGGNQERTAMLSSVRAFFESHGEARFSDVADTTNRVTINRAGFRKSTSEGQEYYVLPEAYKREVCAGFDMKTVTKVLIDAGWLAPDKDGKGAQSKSLPEMGNTRCYVFTLTMWES
jgi:putative DNA primase/helicase